MPRLRLVSATCIAGAKGTSSCGTTGQACIAAAPGPRTRRGSWCARRFLRPTRMGWRAYVRRHGRRRNRHARRERHELSGAAHHASGRYAMSWSGRLLHIHIAKRASLAMEELDEAKLIAGRGIEGDRYFYGTGTYSPKPDAREVTLIEIEVLAAIARGDPPEPGKQVDIAPGEHRRNLTTLGVPLNHLVGKRFKVGETVLRGGRLNFPCKYLEKLLARPVYTALLNRSGLNCRIELGGTIRKGDPITPLDD